MASEVAVGKGEAFISLLRKSQLVDDVKLDEAIGHLEDPVNADPKDLAQSFINMGLLTRFQVRLLLQGKWRGFMIAGKYRLLDMLGEGGMGKVYLCEHQRMQRMVAIKVLPLRLANDTAARERFDREARAIASLNHPNIVQAYDIDSHDGMHYIVMEFVDGVSLQALVALRGPLTVSRAVNYLGQAAAGLQHGNEMGLVHRDIKPANLLLSRDGTVKILDYGLARFFDNRADDFTKRHENGSIIGTADYLAPEQAIDCSDVDVRADLYALGCSMYYMLTGKPPFGRELPTHTKLLLHQSKEPPTIRDLRPDMDPQLSDVIKKLLAKKPEDRFQEPKSLLEALHPWLNQPVPPPTDEEIPLREAMATNKAVAGHSTARMGSSSSVVTKARGKSATIIVDKSTGQITTLGSERRPQLPPWIWAGIGGIIAGIIFLLWPQAQPTYVARQEPPRQNTDELVLPITKGNNLEAQGVQPLRLDVESDATLTARGVLTLKQGMRLKKNACLMIEPGCLVVLAQGSAKVDEAVLKFQLKPEQGQTVVPLIRNETGKPVTGRFQNAHPTQVVRSSDGTWQAKISYQGQAVQQKPTGGLDVVLYDLERVK
jgi:serine/threonine protein kinase